MSSPSSSTYVTILITVVIALVVLRRSYLMSKGVPYSPGRLALLPALLVILWGLTEAESTLLTPWSFPYLIAADVAILLVTAYFFAGVAERATQVYEAPPGTWNYRIGFGIGIFFFVAFTARLALAAALFPASLNFGAPAGGFPPTGQQVVLAVVDAIFSVSGGMIVGRSLGVQRKWRKVSSHAA